MDLEKVEIDSTEETRPASGETINSLFQPDALVNDQYLESFRRGAALEPERELMLAILEDAVKTLQENRGALSVKKKRLFEETRDWFFSDDSTWIFSFVSVCTALGLNPDYLRKGLSRWHDLSLSASLN
jgi:hypothetical protein